LEVLDKDVDPSRDTYSLCFVFMQASRRRKKKSKIPAQGKLTHGRHTTSTIHLGTWLATATCRQGVEQQGLVNTGFTLGEGT
jgi:hypothetical protein